MILGPDQNKTPIIAALRRFREYDPAYFRIPGHRFSNGVDDDVLSFLGRSVFDADLTEAEGLDDLHHPYGAIAEAETLAASLWGSDHCYFLVNGSTSGNEAMLLSCVGEGQKTAIARGAHLSVLSGLIMTGARPVWIVPDAADVCGPDCPVSAEDIRLVLEKEPECGAVFITSPTYYGTCSDVKGIAEVCHERGIPLLVDEAHGPHLRFLSDGPADAVSSGADMVVQSLHKTCGSLTQSSLLHVSGGLIDRERVRTSLKMTNSSSPSYVLMASLDGARHQLAMHGKELMSRAEDVSSYARGRLAGIKGIETVEDGLRDPLRLVISVAGTGMSGTEIQEKLFERHGVSIELADSEYIVAVITWGNTREDADRLADGLEELVKEGPSASERFDAHRARYDRQRALSLIPDVCRTPRESYFSDKESVPSGRAAGRTAAEAVIPYPPGIPVICPGERLTDDVISLAGRRSIICEKER